MSRTGRTLVALGAGAIALVITAWFDSTVMRYAEARERTVGDVSGYASTEMLGSLLVAGSVLLLGVLAWRSASVVVGLAYVGVGGLVVVLPWLFWTLAFRTAPPLLPEALALAVRRLYDLTTGGSDGIFVLNGGPLNADGTIGAAMLIAGIAALTRWWRRRPVAPGRAGVVDATAAEIIDVP